MEAQENSVWQTIAAGRWPGWRVDGDGRIAVTDIETGKVTLFTFGMEAEQFVRQRIGTRKIYVMNHVPAQIDCHVWERD
jgi:hypothetical protein